MFWERNDNWKYILKRTGTVLSLKKAQVHRNMLGKLIEYFVLI